MNTSKNLIFDRIVLLIACYIGFVIISIFVIFAIDSYMNKKMTFINSLLANETAKTNLNHILKHKIEDSRNILLSFLGSDSFDDMDRYEQKLKSVTDSIKELLFVLENGGVYSDKFGVIYKGLENSSLTLTYSNYSGSRYNIQVMDLRARMLDIRGYLDDFRNLVIDMVLARNNMSAERINSVVDRKYIAVKQLDAFYQRVDESSNRLYLEAEESAEIIDKYRSETALGFRSVKIRVNFFLAFILISSGVFMFVNVYRIVRTRKEFSDELNRVNSSLEEVIRDRTEALETEVAIRKLKEEESFEKAQFLMDVIESLAHPFYVIDAETYEIILANNAAYEIIGTRGKTCYELTHRSNSPCDGIDHPCPLKKVIDTGEATTVEHLHTVRNGEKRFFEVHGYPVKNSEGRVVQMIEYSLDITEKKDAEFALINLNSMLEERVAERTKKLAAEAENRKIAEERVKSREKHFRHLIANISDIILIVDRDMRITYLSPSIEQITGFYQEQLLGKSAEDLIHSRDRHLFNVWIEKVKDGTDEQRVVEFRLQKRSGQWINGEALAKNMLESDVISGIIINIRDITIRKRAEDEIRKLALVMEQNPNSIVITDLDANIEYVNPAFEEVTGYSLPEVVGQNPSVLKTEHTPLDVFREMWETIKKGRVWNGEFVNKKKSGELYTEHAIIAPIMNDRGEIVNYLGMKENITELKKAREKAEESSKAKSMFLANMSHEIRTPLNGLMGFLDLLNQTRLSREQADYVDTIRYSADTLLSVLNDVLDLSKIESGMLELEKSDIDLAENIMSGVKTFYAKASEKGINLYTFVDPRIPRTLKGDSLRIGQVLNNLLGNAVKFTPDSGTILVDVMLQEETDKTALVMVSVEDSGVGIPEGKLNAIFESFAQVDTSVTRKYGGTGLGLTISKNLLELMGSEINVTSKEGEGSRFYFELEFEKAQANGNKLKFDKNLKIYIYGGGEPEFYRLLEKYFASMSAEYTFLDKPVQGASYDGAVFIFNNLSYDGSVIKQLLQEHDARIVYIYEDFAGTHAEVQNPGVVKLKRPFSGKALYEGITGETVNTYAEMQFTERPVTSFDGRVLVAEDNTVNVKLMETMLNRFALEPDIVQNGTEALERAIAEEYDIVFMDINMPGMDGMTATRKIREYENRYYKSRTPVVALTAHTLSELDSEFIDTDFDSYISKPVNMNEMEAVLREFLSAKEIKKQPPDRKFDLSQTIEEIGLPKETVLELLRGLVSSVSENIDKYSEFMDNEEYEKLSAMLNSDKGAAGNLRLAEVKQVFSEMEKAVRLKDKERISRHIKTLMRELKYISERLNAGER